MTTLIKDRKYSNKHYRTFYYICERVSTDNGTYNVYYFDGFVFQSFKAMKRFIEDNYLN